MTEEPTPSRWWIVGIGLVLAGGAAAWIVLGNLAGNEAPRGAPDAPSFVPATHVVAGRSSLSTGADGKPVLSVVLRDVVEGEGLHLTVRRSMVDGGAPSVFVKRGRPTSTIGALAATSEATGTPGETRLVATLPDPAERVTLIDLRWEGPRQGVEIRAKDGPAK